MLNEKAIVLSASRKTDYPAFFLPQLKAVLAQGYFYSVNEYSKERKLIEIPKEKVHSISLWSKNYEKFIESPGILDDYNLYFQFTVTGYSNYIERNVPNYQQTVKQMEILSKKYGSDKINWRFDPIAFFPKEAKTKGVQRLANERLETFTTLCELISKTGVERCTISFMDTKYFKVSNRLSNLGVEFYEPNDNEKHEILTKMVDIANANNIQIYSCASPLIEAVPGIKKSACVDGNVLQKLFGGNINTKKDAGQRPDCGCTKSIDLANYDMRCGNNCVYCYANCALK